jgi:streptomycin 3"-adenylyltransferase
MTHMPVDGAPAVARIVHRTLSDTPLGIYLDGSAVLAGRRTATST